MRRCEQPRQPTPPGLVAQELPRHLTLLFNAPQPLPQERKDPTGRSRWTPSRLVRRKVDPSVKMRLARRGKRFEIKMKAWCPNLTLDPLVRSNHQADAERFFPFGDRSPAQRCWSNGRQHVPAVPPSNASGRHSGPASRTRRLFVRPKVKFRSGTDRRCRQRSTARPDLRSDPQRIAYGVPGHPNTLLAITRNAGSGHDQDRLDDATRSRRCSHHSLQSVPTRCSVLTTVRTERIRA